jgi:hypothetical protein
MSVYSTKTRFNVLATVAVLVVCVAVWKWSRPIVDETSSVRRPKAISPAPSGVESRSASSLSDVQIVKTTVLAEYTTKTVGSAFETTFQDSKWRVLSTRRGETIVEFTGTVKYTAFRDAGFYIGTWNGVQQGIEFAGMIADQKQRCLAEAGRRTNLSVTDESTIAVCMEKAYHYTTIPVLFEFRISPDRKRVEIASVDAVFQRFDTDHRLRRYDDATLKFIYE